MSSSSRLRSRSRSGDRETIMEVDHQLSSPDGSLDTAIRRPIPAGEKQKRIITKVMEMELTSSSEQDSDISPMGAQTSKKRSLRASTALSNKRIITKMIELTSSSEQESGSDGSPMLPLKSTSHRITATNTSRRVTSSTEHEDVSHVAGTLTNRSRRAAAVTADKKIIMNGKAMALPLDQYPGSNNDNDVPSVTATSRTSKTKSNLVVTKAARPITAIKMVEMSSSSEDELDEEVKSVTDRMVNKAEESMPDAEVNPWAKYELEDSNRVQSPTVPTGQYEIEDVIDYVKDDVGDMYLIKWKKWDSDFNTWEPPANLINCDEELLNFYRKRKAEMEEVMAKSEYVIIAGGKRRRKGPPMVQVPPDPRPFEVRVQEFCSVTKPMSEKEILKVYPEWIRKFILPRGKDRQLRWPIAKVNKLLQDGVDGKLDIDEMDSLRLELIYIEIDKRRAFLYDSLKKWQAKINSMTKETPFISVENDVDFEGPPEGFEFVNDYIPSAGIRIPSDPPVGCACGDSCYDNRNVCCAKQFGSSFAYTKFRKVAVSIGTPIYECNRKCKCSSECSNRVVQDGKTEMKLSIFRTSTGCGWGVKTLKSIKRGCFVTLYVGEVIFNEEGAEDRAKKDGHSYLFDLDFNDQENPLYSVDASRFGNVAHFINHSCDPNLGVYAVWIDCLDPNLPKLAMFATRDIQRGEELSFDYTNQLSSDSNKTIPDDVPDASVTKERKKCLCGAAKCRKFLF